MRLFVPEEVDGIAQAVNEREPFALGAQARVGAADGVFAPRIGDETKALRPALRVAEPHHHGHGALRRYERNGVGPPVPVDVEDQAFHAGRSGREERG